MHFRNRSCRVAQIDYTTHICLIYFELGTKLRLIVAYIKVDDGKLFLLFVLPW